MPKHLTPLIAALLLVMSLVAPGASADAVNHVHLVLKPVSGSDPCHTGETQRSVPPEGLVHLIACTFDDAHQATSTGSTPEALQWQLSGPAHFEEVGTETGEAGQTTATVALDGLGTVELTVRLCADDTCSAVGAESTSVLAVVHEDPPPPECSDGVDNEGDGATDFPEDTSCADPEDAAEGFYCPSYSWASGSCFRLALTIRYRDERFIGVVGHPRDACVAARLVKLKKVLPGPNRTLGRDRTGSRGNWRIGAFPNARGRFYAVVRQKTVTTDDGVSFFCRRDRSVTIFIR